MADDFIQPPTNPEPVQPTEPQSMPPVMPSSTPPPSLSSDQPLAPTNPQMQPTSTEPGYTPMQEVPKNKNIKKILGLVGGFIFGFLIVGLIFTKMSSKDAKPFTVSDLAETTEGVYTFKYNRNWVKSSDASLPVAYGDSSNFTQSNAGFAFAPSQSIGGDWEDFSETQKSTFTSTYTNYVEKELPGSLGCESVGELKTNPDYTISGIDKVVKIDISCEKLKAGYSVKDAKMNLLMMIKGRKAHIAVAISGPIESYDKSADAFEAMFQSIKIED